MIERNEKAQQPVIFPLHQKSNGLLTEVTTAGMIDHIASEVDFIDFNIQKLIPHKLTQYGPSLAVGDINGDGMDDLIVGGGSPQYATAYLQNTKGTFRKQPILNEKNLKYQDDAGICLFDADSDGDLDLYIASGGC